MGMAASQARLLSITSRMSDNELRAQLINNSKMRLATESSQVSEAYVAALNEAQMMYTNYGANDTTSYQNLTFNALTNYSQYNNQYGLSNASGMLLVSEKDAKNYKNANGKLDNFLAAYGLTKGTTYFDNLGQKYIEDDGTVTGLGYTAEELKAMYYGDGDYQGYQGLLTSESYFKYNDLTEKLIAENDSLLEKSWEGIKDKILGKDDYADYRMPNGMTFNKFIEDTTANNNQVNGYNPNYYPGKIDSFMKYIDGVTGVLAGGSNNALYKKVKGILGDALDKYHLSTTDSDGNYVQSGGSYNKTYNPSTGISGVIDSADVDTTDDPNTLVLVFDGTAVKVHKNGSTFVADPPYDNAGGEDPIPEDKLGMTATVGTDGTLSVIQMKQLEDDEGNITGISDTDKVFETKIDLNELFKAAETFEEGKNYTVDSEYTYYQEEIEADLQSRFDYAVDVWTDSLKYNIIPYKFDGVGNTDTYKALAEELARFVFRDSEGTSKIFASQGGPIQDTDYPSLMTVEGIQALIDTYPDKLKLSSDFNLVLDLLTLENMMDLYGEPNVTWIDNTDTNGTGNAEKKAQWYTNLFERMGNGYVNNFKVLSDGLASSAEWIKYALESGLVSMEQVNKSNEWNSITYSNCSDITEQNNNTAVTKAEAQYKKAMNKIETKDKQYDMELKNIDTEHNSLQTEYDSIKSVIDKNVERTFKIYS